jgi:hypothetical protein
MCCDYFLQGRQLTFVDDEVAMTGLGWVSSLDLKYNQVRM